MVATYNCEVLGTMLWNLHRMAVSRGSHTFIGYLCFWFRKSLIYSSDLKEIRHHLSRLKTRLHMADSLWGANRTELTTSSSKVDSFLPLLPQN